MQRTFAILPLLLIVSSVAATWDTPKIFHRSNINLDIVDTFKDPTTNHLHVLAHHDSAISYYIRLTPDRVVSAMFQLPNGTVFGDTLKITGKGDGKALFIAFADVRGRIVFLESGDHGNSWMKPQRIGNGTGCFFGSLKYIESTERLYMVYSCYDKPEGVVFVSRPAGSTVFAREKVIVTPKVGIFSLDSVFTLKQGVPMIHVFYVEVNAVKYSRSEDNGVTWTWPLDMEVFSQMDVKVMANPKVSDSMFVFFGNTLEKVGMMYSNDHGRRFTYETYFPGRLYYLSSQVCGSREHKVMVTAIKGGNYTYWKGWEGKADIKTESGVLPPFADTYGALACDGISPGNGIKISMLGRAKEESGFVYAIGTDSIPSIDALDE